jgi:REP element-mobilizing transposase RayT
MRTRYEFVVMPEQVHLLASEPKQAPLSKAIQALKLAHTWQLHI